MYEAGDRPAGKRMRLVVNCAVNSGRVR